MSVIFILIPLSIVIGGGFLIAFFWAVRSGQYEDTLTPSLRVLLDESGVAIARRPTEPSGKPPDAIVTALCAGDAEAGVTTATQSALKDRNHLISAVTKNPDQNHS